MKTNKILMTVSFLTLMTVTVPAMADSTVLCSVRQSMKSAAYQPGVDVKGKPVVGADVNSSVAGIPKSMTIPLTVDLAQAYNTVLPAGGKLEAQVGLVEVQSDGKVIINGKDFSGPTEAVCSSAAVEARNKAAALRTKDAPKAKKKKAPKAEVAADTPPVEAAPPAPVAPPEAALAPAPEAAPQPQVLDAQPPALPTPPAPEAAVPQPVPVAPPAPALPTPPDAAPVPPPSGAIVSPTEGMPRPPMDPLTGAPQPAPVPPAPADGTLSGGSQ